MQLGQTIKEIRKENNLTQEGFAELFHVTRQTVSNWENEKSYPDLLTLIAISDRFSISLDKMLKEDIKMTEKLNKEINGEKVCISWAMYDGGKTRNSDILVVTGEDNVERKLSASEKAQYAEVIEYGFDLYNAVYR